MAYKWAELQGLTDRDLTKKHDEAAVGCGSRDWLTLYRDELHHRQLHRHTKAMTWMTVIIVVATVVNIVLWVWDKFWR
jgi:hypothetical protein